MKSLDIHIGAGHVPFAQSTTTRDNTYHPAGYVLPGGQRTDDRARAELVAANISERITGRPQMLPGKP